MSKDINLSDQKKISETTWLWIMITVFVSPLIIDYLAPVFTGVTYIIYKFELKRKGLPYHKFPTYIKFLIVFLVYQFVNILHSGYYISSLWTSFLWLAMFTAYLFITNIVNTHEKIKKIMYLATLSAGIAGLIGIIQMVLIKFGPHQYSQLFNDLNPLWQKPSEFVVKNLIPFDDLPKDLTPVNLQKVKVTNLNVRANSTFTNPCFFAIYLVAILPFAIYLGLLGFNKKEERKKKWISIVCIILIVGGIAASYTRAAYIAVAVCIIIFAFVGKKYAKRIGIAIPIVLLLLPNSVYKRFLTLFGNDKSVNERTAVYKASWDVIKENWLIGIGTGNVNLQKIFLKNYKQLHFVKPQPHAHNIFLEFWVEGGIFEVAIFLTFCVLLFIELIKLCKLSKQGRELGVTFISSFAGLFVCGMTDFIFYGPKILQLFMIIMGLAQAAVFVSIEKSNNAIEENPQTDEIKEPPDETNGNNIVTDN